MASEFGVIETGPDGGITVHEKVDAQPCLGSERVYASMEITSSTNLLLWSCTGCSESGSSHDFGRDILPGLIDARCSRTIFRPTESRAIRLIRNRIGAMSGPSMLTTSQHGSARGDAGAESLQSQMALRTAGYSDAPAKFIFVRRAARPGAGFDVAEHYLIRRPGARSVWAARVHSGALVEDSIIFDNCDIGRELRCGKRSSIRTFAPEDAVIGYDLKQDRKLYHVTDSGIVVIEGHRSRIWMSRHAGVSVARKHGNRGAVPGLVRCYC